ncbi:MAG: peptide ABC transporter substrate-binding protein [Steroidobacteraceae bacterium]
MQQVTEIAGIAINRLEHAIRFVRHLLQCSIALVIIVGGAACDHRGTDKDASGNGVRILRRGLPGEPRTLDPQLADDNYSFQIVRDLYEGLTSEDPTGRVVPGVANSWTVDDTGTIYTFQFRPDAKWSNGDQIVAAEFVQGMRRAVNPKTASGSAGLLTVIRGASEIIAGRKNVTELGVTAIGDTSIRIELEHPAPYLLQILSQPIAAPVHMNAHPAISLSDYSIETSGSYNGAYTLVNRVPGSFIELERNPNYWDSSNVSIERVRYINAESETTELREYIAGQLDMTFTIPLPDLSRVMQQFGAEVQIAPILGNLYLALNLSKLPLKDSAELRQALSMAIDREQIADQVMMGVTPAYAFVADGVSGYVAPRYEWAEWTRDRQLSIARSLYARAGYSVKNPLHLRLYFNSGESIQRIMLAIASSWKQNLGVISELASEEFQVFLAGRKDRGRWDVTRLGWDADYDDPSSFLDLFSQGNSQNDPAYKSVLFNQLIDKAGHEPESGKRMVLLHSAEEVLLNDYPIIPIYFKRVRRLVKPYVGGAQITPMNRTYTKNLYWKRVS